ncbi:MAG: PP2C family protein-serine/threonine phosphatase [Ornithinimicrobium sp.]|uniref:PP2C family protein-serine/threonine phosphatase n=1 Tax=Ornithinimicrobium sp. TaxID=1977084 RepID=UPI003D9B04BE
MSVALRYAARSHIGLGTKSRNEDSAYAGPELLVLCDGMGGHAAGDVASSLVVGELVHLDGESHGADDMLDVLEGAIMDANDRLSEVAHESTDADGMGTTCIAMMRSGDKLAVANIGDSRAYLRRGSRVTQITRDHSFVQQLLDEGRIGPEEAAHHPQRSLVTRVLTGRGEDHPDLSMRELRAGDRILICSDGLTDYVAESTVADILRSEGSAGDIADQLVAIALRGATRDNITVVVADAVNSGDAPTNPQVVGAVSDLRRGEAGKAAGGSPAEKAAALSRHTQEEPEAPALAEEDGHRGALRWVRRGTIAIIVLVVVGAGGWASWAWSQQQYFVGVDDGQVAIFRGVSQDLGPWALSRPETTTDLALADLPTYYQGRVEASLSADNRSDADSIVSELRALVALDCTPVPVQPGQERTTTAAPTLPLPDSANPTAEPGAPGPPQSALPRGCPP